MLILSVFSHAFADLYNRAPETLPWLLPEMNTPGYWINKMERPDEIVMSFTEIEKMNRDYIRRISASQPFENIPEDKRPNVRYWWPGLVTYMPDLDTLSPEAVADTVKLRISAEIAYLREMPFGNALAVEYSEKELSAFEHNMAFDQLGDTITIRHGITVCNARLRNIPTFTPDQIGLRENGKTRWDVWNIGVVKIGRPVYILHRSKTGGYLFVLSDVGYGWLRSEDVAFGTKSDIDAFTNSEPFVVCTDNRVNYYTAEDCRFASGWFGMGTRLPLIQGSKARKVKIPSRRVDGTFFTETAWLAPDADIHTGWLPFTRRNIVETAFKLLGTIYDWTGAWYGRAHETIYQDIFACFGFRLPNYGALFNYYGNNTEVVPPDAGKEEQYRRILEHEPFITIQTCGSHAQILLGEYNGIPVVFDLHGYGYQEDDGTEIEIRRCHIGDMRLPSYFLTRNVYFLTFEKD